MRGAATIGMAGVVAAAVLVVMVTGECAGAATAPADTRTVVLDTYGIWRMHCTLSPPVLVSGETVQLKYAWLNYRTPGPADDWTGPDFDDRFWHRGPVTLACKSAVVARACLRGKFTVTDPAAVKGLSLSAGYRGGLVVTVNGTEVHREHIAAGASVAAGPAGAERRLADLAIANRLLRKGMNVVALDVVRAPYVRKAESDLYEDNACEILTVRLTSSTGAGVVPNTARPEGLQVWNANVMAVDFGLDFGDPAEPLRPVTIMGARNGMFSGKVVVGATQPIQGLKVTLGDLTGTGGRIAASNVRVRYGTPWGHGMVVDGTKSRRDSPYPTWANRLGALGEQPLDVFGVLKPTRGRSWFRFKGTHEQVTPVPGAVVPVWITVRVPADVRAGTYTGTVTIAAGDHPPVAVPLEVHVADWTLPDTQDFRTWVDIIQCPDTSAVEYGVPLWSDRHFEMIARSFKLIGETGSRILYIPLIAHTNFGNEESMVRWVKRGDGYGYDFSIMDRYLDVAEKHMGRPKALVFVVWDVYMLPTSDVGDEGTGRKRQKQMAEHVGKVAGSLGHGPMVTTVDVASGKTKNVNLPPHFDAKASRTLWKPLFDELRKRLQRRGLEKTMLLGVQCDAWASKEEHAFFHDVTGGVPWVVQSHEGHRDGKLMHGISRIGYQARVWAVRFSDDGADRKDPKSKLTRSLSGWQRPDLVAQFDRFSRESHPNTRWRHLAESCITGAQRGPGRLGGEYWRVLKDKRGQRKGRSHDRYPESTWRNLFICDALLAPGPDGPVATDRLEAFREGVQECEARIAVERALKDKTLRARLGADLVRRAEAYLHARHMMMWLSLSNLQLYYNYPDRKWRSYMAYGWRGQPNLCGDRWFLGSDWRKRSEKLYTLAAEVAAGLEKP